jgi:hypothetical protein
MHGRKPIVAGGRLAAWREQSSVVAHRVPDMTKIIDRSYYTTTIGRILDTFFLIFGDHFQRRFMREQPLYKWSKR